MTGAEIVLAQQQRLLNRSTLSAEDKQAKIDAQKRIHEAVITGKGLELLPPDVRRAGGQRGVPEPARRPIRRRS